MIHWKANAPSFASAVVLAAVVLVAGGGDPSDLQDDALVAVADRAFANKTYQAALDAYRAALAAPGGVSGHERAAVRIGECLALLNRGDEALAELAKTIAAKPGSRVARRAAIERGVIALTMPHHYSEKDGKRTRGEWVQGGAYAWTEIEDHLLGTADLESAVMLGIRHATEGGPAWTAEDRRAHLRALLELASGVERLVREIPVGNDRVDPSGPAFVSGRSWQDRMFGAYTAATATAEEIDRDAAALSLYLHAHAARRSLRSFRWSGAGLEVGAPGSPAWTPLPPDRDPLKLFAAAREKARGTKAEDVYVFGLADTLKHVGAYVEAVKVFREIRTSFPKSKFDGDAAYAIDELTTPRLDLQGVATLDPDRPGEISVPARNLTSFDAAIYRTDAPRDWIADDYLEEGKYALNDFAAFLKETGFKPRAEAQVAAFTVTTGDTGDHVPFASKLAIPALKRGVYVMRVSGGPHVRLAALVVSDLGVVVKTDAEKTHVFVVDGTSGVPIRGAEVVVRERWTSRGVFGVRWIERHVRATTDQDGLVVRPHEVREEHASSTIEVAAVDGDRMVFAPPQHVWRPGVRELGAAAYVMTDRPVYRPGDVIRIAAIATRRTKTDPEPMRAETFEVLITDPQGGKVFEQSLRSDADGAFDLELKSGKTPPLGQYQIRIRRYDQDLRQASFRVEEYLKPEFTVAVEKPREELRLGAKATATIAGDYYFGGGVAGGQVVWKVLREPFRPSFRRNEPWRAFYGGPVEDLGPATSSAGRELVASGSGVMDSLGRLKIEFETAPYAGRNDFGSRFVVQADVTDSARRTISGEDDVVIAAQGLAFDVRPNRGFFAVGETVECELQSVLPSGLPAAAKGVFKTFKVKPATHDADGKEKTPEVLTELAAAPGEADDKGIGFFRTTIDDGGLYLVRFEARDRFETLCSGETRFWVYGGAFRGDGFEMKNVELVPARRTYKPGDTALILVQAERQDAAVFVTVEAGRNILASYVVRLQGKSALLELPITTAHAPNVFVHAATVRAGGYFETTTELFVPPVEKFLDVSLAFRKPEWKPGSTGELDVVTKDVNGAPVAARAVVTVLDASLFYIQNDVTPDIRRFFYGERRYAGVNHGASARWMTHGVVVVSDVAARQYRAVGGPAASDATPGTATRLLNGGALDAEAMLGWGVGGRKPGFGGGLVTLGARMSAGSDEAAPTASAERAATADHEAPMRTKNDDGPRSRDDKDAASTSVANVAVRTDFRDSALWAAVVRTDATGRTTLKVPFPENTTRWRAKAWGFTSGLAVGEGTADAVTTQPLVARLRTPRFFVEGDVVTVTGSLNNRTNAPIRAAAMLEIADASLVGTTDPLRVDLDLPALGLGRVEWRLRVLKSGEAILRFRGASGDDGDGLEVKIPIVPWGADKRVFDAAVLENDAAATLTFLIPPERRAETTRLAITLQPSLALTLVDALPYLIDYPYGCTEQTISRFAPAALVARTLREAGTTLSEVARRKAALPKAALQGEGRERRGFDFELDDVVQAGLKRLRDLQHSDGGFGWWENDLSNVYMTAYALQGLLIARDADVKVDAGLINGAASFLSGALPDERRLETAVFAAYVLARAGRPEKAVAAKAFAARDGLSIYGRALLASALKHGGEPLNARLVVQAFDDVARPDPSNGTVHFGANGGGWWHWWESRLETNSAVLGALLDVDPASRHAAPLAKWLVMNRRGNRWTNTRDTAHAIFALVRYAKTTGELDPTLEVEVELPGRPVRRLALSRQDLFSFEGTMELSGADVPSGAVTATIRTKGKGRIYASGEASFFTQEAEIAAAGRELLVERSYYLVTTEATRSEIVDGRPAVLVAERFAPIANGATLAAGDVVEVRLLIDSKNDYEHLLFEDMKPAGFEPLEVRSGGRYENGICSNIEFRDRKTALFVTWLEQGKHVVRYRLRAELPGELRAAPARGEAMYAPDIGGTSSSFRFTVKDAGPR